MEQDWRLPVVERGLRGLAELAEAGGGSFLARRMTQEAWPALAQLLRRGPRRRPSDDDDAATHQQGGRLTLTGGEDDGQASQAHAPATVDRARAATMQAITR